MMRMLDTNICIYVINKKPPHVIQKLVSLAVMDVCISAVTFAELQYGAHKSQNPKSNCTALNEFIHSLQVKPFDISAAQFYGKLRAELEVRGRPIGSLDLMIAAHSSSLEATLVTNNVKEFARIPGLKIENWASLE